MNEQQRPWRLPDGVKFYVWPKYLLIVEGVEVKLAPTQAKVVLFLMANAGRRFHSNEIMDAIFADREDGGATHKTYIPVVIVGIINRCRKAGVDICLKQSGAHFGYAFMGISLTARGRSEADRLKVLPAHDPQSPLRPREFNGEKPPKRSGPIKHHPYIDIWDGTGGWTFPLRIELDHHRRKKIGGG